jgi:hypothetical protein
VASVLGRQSSSRASSTFSAMPFLKRLGLFSSLRVNPRDGDDKHSENRLWYSFLCQTRLEDAMIL